MLSTEDLKIIEHFISKEESIMEIKEIQAVVKMQYDIYRLLLMPKYVISIDQKHNFLSKLKSLIKGEEQC